MLPFAKTQVKTSLQTPNTLSNKTTSPITTSIPYENNCPKQRNKSKRLLFFQLKLQNF